jgi:hypothetical protein
MREISMNDAQVEWDNYLIRFSDYNILQCYSFGEYYKNKSISTELKRYILFDGNKPVIMGQAKIKEIKTISAVFIYMKGGPLYNLSDSEKKNVKYLKKYLNEFVNLIKNKYKLYYLNFQLTSESGVAEELVLRECGWSKPIIERSLFLTYRVQIYKDINDNFKSFDPKWRNQLRRAEKVNHYFEWGNSDTYIKRYIRMHNTMFKMKKMKKFMLKDVDLCELKQNMKDHMQVLIVSVNNKDVSGCVILLFEKKAYYVYAASNELGRSYYSSNVMIWNLIKRLHDIGVNELDLLGVDPHKNWGGYHFKKGIGGQLVKFVGEWEHSSTNFIKVLMNTLFFLRK